jgi:hypothetical protein
MPFSIMDSFAALSINGIQNNGIQCRYFECPIFIVTLSVIKLNVIMLYAVAPGNYPLLHWGHFSNLWPMQ